MEVPQLRTAQPKRIEEAESAIGDIDSALKKASQAGDAVEEDKFRIETKLWFEQCLRTCLQLHALGSLDYTESNLNATRRDAKFLLQTDNRKTVFLLSTDPFPARASTHSPDMSKGIGNIDREFNAAIVWMLKQRGQTDIVVVSDGRSDCARMEIRKVFEREIGEECVFF